MKLSIIKYLSCLIFILGCGQKGFSQSEKLLCICFSEDTQKFNMNENKDSSLSVFNIRIKKPKEKTSTNNRRTEKDENVIIITESEDKPSYVLNYISGNRQEVESLDSCEEKVDVEQFYEKWKELSGKYGLSKVYFYKVRKDKSFWIWKAFKLGKE